MEALPRRKNIRLKRYDYRSDGHYFMTIDTHQQRPLIDKYRGEVEKMLFSLPERFPGLAIDWHSIMPTHVHVIFIFRGMGVWLGEVVRTFKALVAKSTEHPFWQRNYYEHVIRSDDALLKIRTYMQNNPTVERIKFEELDKSGSDKSDHYTRL
jgi:putative transposase